DHSEDGECSSSPKRPDVVEILDSGCFVLDIHGNEEEDVVLNTSDFQSKEEENAEDDEDHSSKKDSKKTNWRRSAVASVMKMDGDEEEVVKVEKKDNRRKPQCFNCNGEHNMVSCPEPKNFRRIRENREAFQEARAKDSRYTEAQSGGNGEFKPGRLSNDLQRALGIGPNDIPEFVYRMRRMGFTRGYPPGYLKNAIVKQTNPSDLLTFHSDNPELKDDKEEGDERPLSPTVNPEKVIYYFGFNQTYRALKDREQFLVPPFHEFVQCLSGQVKKEFWEEKKRGDRKRKTSAIEQDGKKARKEEDDDDCMILEAPPPPPLIVMDVMEEEKGEEIGMGDTSLNHSSIDSPSTSGTPASRRFSVGTPVLQRKNLGDGMKKVPSLDAFAVGIVPFQVDEPTAQTGFLKKMLKKIKDKLG
ncbi:hypothetical protein PENTCL1PPCAC_11591, partial [Pristionchus entomophagus]